MDNMFASLPIDVRRKMANRLYVEPFRNAAKVNSAYVQGVADAIATLLPQPCVAHAVIMAAKEAQAYAERNGGAFEATWDGERAASWRNMRLSKLIVILTELS